MPTSFNLQVSRPVLALLNYSRLDSKSDPTFAKMVFKYRYANFPHFPEFFAGILENPYLNQNFVKYNY